MAQNCSWWTMFRLGTFSRMASGRMAPWPLRASRVLRKWQTSHSTTIARRSALLLQQVSTHLLYGSCRDEPDDYCSLALFTHECERFSAYEREERKITWSRSHIGLIRRSLHLPQPYLDISFIPTRLFRGLYVLTPLVCILYAILNPTALGAKSGKIALAVNEAANLSTNQIHLALAVCRKEQGRSHASRTDRTQVPAFQGQERLNGATSEAEYGRSSGGKMLFPCLTPRRGCESV